MPTIIAGQEFLSLREAADYLGLNYNTLALRHFHGKGPCRAVDQPPLYTRADLDDYKRRNAA